MIMLTKVVNNNKPEQRTKSMHILFSICLRFVCSFSIYVCVINLKLKDFQGVSRGRLCHFTLFILTFIADSYHRLDIFVE